jgi:hypothetical protein
MKRALSTGLLCLTGLFAGYVGSYFWFRSSHSHMTFSSSAPITEISTSLADSVLLTLFDPALRLDGAFGPSRVYIRTDSSGEALLRYKRFPFAELVPQPNIPSATTQ